MKKNLVMKGKAICLAAFMAVSTLDMTAFATAPSTQEMQTQELAQEQVADTESTDVDVSGEATDVTLDSTDASIEVEAVTEDTQVSEENEVISTEEVEVNEEEADVDSIERQMSYNRIDNLMIPSLYDGTYYPDLQGTLPSSYDSRTYGYITPVKDQGSWGTCWSFSAIGMAEANIVKKGLANNTLDLSELQLAYFFYNTVTDPLGNTKGDSTQALEESYLNQGGNSVFTTFALANWCGAALESKAPYEKATSEYYSLNSSLAYDDAYHMQNAYWINMTDKEDVKDLIMNYGAIATSYYSDQIGNVTTTYYNNPNRAYYYDRSYNANHAIIIVGWDDSFSRTKFNRSHRPSSDGAWLVKNSWSSDFGDDGYFWISYEDSALTDSDYSMAFVFDFESADNYDHNYQYDGSSSAYSDTVYNGGSIANTFTAKANSGGKEQIEAVSFALYDVNTDYSIQIYKNPTNGQDPTSGTALLSTPKTGRTSYTGYYTVPLDKAVTVADGDKFSVVITLSKSSSRYVNYFCDYSYNNGSWIKFTNAVSSGQSFVKTSKYSSWKDMSSSKMTPRLKAFTSDVH